MEKGIFQLQNERFSVIALRKGTVCGYSPRMRLDLVMNSMFKSAWSTGEIIVNNPSIWRPILSVQDAANAYIRAIECSENISGIFNIACGNYTIGEIGDYVVSGVHKYMNCQPRLIIDNKKDLRNYKVDFSKAKEVLSFHPTFGIEEIVKDLIDNKSNFKYINNPIYYNIETFKRIIK